MSDENDRFALRVDDLVGGGDVTLERKRRILHDLDAIAVLLHVVVDTLPARAVHETAVNEHGQSPMLSQHP